MCFGLVSRVRNPAVYFPQKVLDVSHLGGPIYGLGSRIEKTQEIVKRDDTVSDKLDDKKKEEKRKTPSRPNMAPNRITKRCFRRIRKFTCAI